MTARRRPPALLLQAAPGSSPEDEKAELVVDSTRVPSPPASPNLPHYKA